MRRSRQRKIILGREYQYRPSLLDKAARKLAETEYNARETDKKIKGRYDETQYVATKIFGGMISGLASLPFFLSFADSHLGHDVSGGILPTGVGLAASWGIGRYVAPQVVRSLYAWKYASDTKRERFEHQIANELHKKHPGMSKSKAKEAAHNFYVNESRRLFSRNPPKNPYKVVKNPKGSAFSYRKVKS